MKKLKTSFGILRAHSANVLLVYQKKDIQVSLNDKKAIAYEVNC